MADDTTTLVPLCEDEENNIGAGSAGVRGDHMKACCGRRGWSCSFVLGVACIVVIILIVFGFLPAGIIELQRYAPPTPASPVTEPNFLRGARGSLPRAGWCSFASLPAMPLRVAIWPSLDDIAFVARLPFEHVR